MSQTPRWSGDGEDLGLIPQALQRRLMELALKVPDEAAGWLLLRDGAVEATCTVGSAGRFLLDPLELMEAEDRGLELIGIWHSHRGGGAIPSPSDHAAARAWPGTLWVILGLGAEACWGVFRATEEGLVEGSWGDVGAALQTDRHTLEEFSLIWDKTSLFTAWSVHLDGLLADLRGAQDAAKAGTRVDGDHRPENRGERAAVTAGGYLASALGERIGKLERSRQQMRGVVPGRRGAVVVGALLHLEDEGGERGWYAVLPGGQGDGLEQEGQSIRIVSPRAPIVVALRGLKAGDSGSVERRGEEIEVEILEIR